MEIECVQKGISYLALSPLDFLVRLPPLASVAFIGIEAQIIWVIIMHFLITVIYILYKNFAVRLTILICVNNFSYEMLVKMVCLMRNGKKYVVIEMNNFKNHLNWCLYQIKLS